MISVDLTPFMKLTEEVEGRVDHLYLDTEGVVTCGVGHALHNASEASALDWIMGVTPSPPEATSVRAEYAKVAGASKGLPAYQYAHLCVNRLSDAAIDNLLREDTFRFMSEIDGACPSFILWPQSVQCAVFDMAFNLGLAGLNKFHNLMAALDAKDWARCARECHRTGISADRNKRTAAMFTAALA